MNKTYLLVLATALFLFGSCTKVEKEADIATQSP